MRIDAETSLRDIAFEVCTALSHAGTTAVLTGGGAATLSAPEAIQSYDLDFILTAYGGDGSAGEALAALGYSLRGQHYEHSTSQFLLEYPPGPLAIGDELITKWTTLKEGDRLLHLLTATDSCRDRLAAFYHFHDRSALQQALAIQGAQPERTDLELIERWSKREGQVERCAEFLQSARSGA